MAKRRSIKVYGQSGYKYQETPTIMLKGMWLKELGFEIGDEVLRYADVLNHRRVHSPMLAS